MDIEEVRKVTDEKILEISNYIHNADISATEKARRRLELSISLFMASIAMNSEKMAKRYLAHHLLILINAAEETIDLHFNDTKPKHCKPTKINEYMEKK